MSDQDRLWNQFPEVRRAPRVVGHRNGETAVSILVRLAMANRMRDYRHLLRSTPHLRIKQVNNRDRRIEVAARLSGFEAHAIAAATPTRMTGQWMSVAGFVFNRFGTRPGRTCPDCVAADRDAFVEERPELRPYRRGWWQVPAITTCPQHRVTLVARCGGCGEPFDERVPIGRCVCGNAGMQGVRVDDEACIHDRWLLGRLGLAPAVSHPFLDALPHGTATEFCRVLGRSGLGERVKTANSDTPDRLAEARSAGWRILEEGYHGLERAFDEMIERNHVSGSVCNTSYGHLHRFLTMNTDPALDGVRGLLAEHAKVNVGLNGSRARLFGRVVIDGEKVSIVQGAKILGVSDSYLASVLSTIDPEFRLVQAGPTLIDRSQLLAARDVFTGTMRSSEVQRVLGVDKRFMVAARESGALEYAVPSSAGNFGLIWRHSVQRLLRLFERPPVTTKGRFIDGLLLARCGRVSAQELMLAVVTGRLKPVGRRKDRTGFTSLLFDPAIAGDLAVRLRGVTTRTDAMTRLGWMPGTIMELQRCGLVEANTAHRVALKDLAAVRERYVTANEMSGWLKEKPGTIYALHDLVRRWCGPPIISGKAITAFWPRAQAAARLRSLMADGANIQPTGFGFDD